MVNIEQIGKQIGEQIANPPLPCYYPGAFKPPNKGHFNAVESLAGKNYINQVIVLIGNDIKNNVTPQQSKAIWDLYLESSPNPKVKIIIAKNASPIQDLFSFFANLKNEAYVAGSQEETTNGYVNKLQEKFSDRVHSQVINDHFTDKDGEDVGEAEFVGTINKLKENFNKLRKQQKGTKEYTIVLNDYNNTYDYLKSLMPESLINKGLFDDFLKTLKINPVNPKSLQEDNNYNKEKNWVWLEEYKNHNQLNPMLFDGETLDPQVKELLLRIATMFWDGLEVPFPFDDVVLTGSSANYNYTNNSDIDLHIIIDFNKFSNPEMVKKWFDSAKNNWNNAHDPKLGKQPIEIYVQDLNEKHTSTGVYSVLNNKWEKKPEYESINIPDGNIKKKSRPFKEKINQLLKTGNKNPEKSIEQIKIIQERLKNFRQAGLDEKGEYSVENLAFKDLRNTGYLDKLNDLKNELIDKTISLNESSQHNIQSLLNNFVSYACQELQIQNPPTLEIRYEFGEEQPSFGAYVPSDHHIFINPSNRNIVDIYRTVAHELVHAKQNEMGLLKPDSGDTGSDIENDANSIAGIIMRDYGKQNPDIYKVGVLNESETKKTITCDNCGWTWKKEDGGKDMYVCHKCGHDNTPKLNEIKNTKITRIYFDLDGVLANFNDQFKKYNDEKLAFEDYIRKHGAKKAWDIINKGEVKYWSTMNWNPGGKELYDYVMKMAPKKDIEVWILSSPGLDPNGDAKKGKNEWLNKHTSIPQNRRVFKQAKDKHTEAKEGYILIDDMGKNATEFTQAGGIGIKNNPENSTESIKKLHKYEL
jgi:nicotinamide mononucleotide adenylyltransferase